MAKATIRYTTRHLNELGLFVEVPGKTDSDRTRHKAIEEIQRRMDDPDETSLHPDSFADGLSIEDLIVVEPPATENSDEDEPEIIQAVKAIANLASLRVTLEESHQQALELRPLIEALFSPAPLTPAQMQQATDKNFAKTLIKFAEAKAARDKFLPQAETAWQVLQPALASIATNSEDSKKGARG
ncbi:MAG TPA: hypothetical protein DEA78_05140 [Cyanobacteria bacterium UBA11159]|nr:hypothetical protein [Cyanobacteria bacterium UBA11367]HBE58385.1 hypothetical protein [Cyanobacteria bacterium UBA11366]HBK63611.1 hypothetical protein [Cyanobacteria bacterium UBA11166]HBR73107.1 hypothetical protein [Cyanobacteria bacterium UBA11159]HBS68017.1 hypothetical protein [Cyanobacteria bacterium UBA11153]HCA93463.1 hypothetical protein [Cyanobacteria bacterium UBA9226]